MDNPPASLPAEAIAYAQQFFSAARRGDLEVFKAPLRAGLPPNLTNEKGDSLLMLATYHGHTELLSLLLYHGADPNSLTSRGQSALAGSIFKKEEACTRILLAAGADPDWPPADLGGPTARACAAIFKVSETWDEAFDSAVGLGKGDSWVPKRRGRWEEQEQEVEEGAAVEEVAGR